jgi:RNA polymerase sigma-70 factor, ECF subfamily
MVFFMNDQINQSSKVASPDHHLIASLHRRDAKALAQLYDCYGDLVHKLALRILGQPEEAADLTQEVFLQLWHKPDRYNPDRGSLTVFLSVVTRSQALNRIRQRKSQQQLFQRLGRGNMLIHSESSVLDDLSLAELSKRVRQALQQIPPEQRKVLEMAYYEGLSQSDITAKTGIPLGTVKTRSRQGLLKLNKLLKDLAE